MRRSLLIVVGVLTIATPIPAMAEPPDAPVVDLALGQRNGNDVDVMDARLFAGRSFTLGNASGRWRPYLAVGAHVGLGSLVDHWDDGRATRLTLGFEARLGVTLVTSQPWVFFEVAAAPLLAVATDAARDFHTPVAEVDGTGGLRLALAVGMPQEAFPRSMKGQEVASGAGGVLLVLLMIPKTVELTLEIIDGPGGAVYRHGIALGWTF